MSVNNSECLFEVREIKIETDLVNVAKAVFSKVTHLAERKKRVYTINLDPAVLHIHYGQCAVNRTFVNLATSADFLRT